MYYICKTRFEISIRTSEYYFWSRFNFQIILSVNYIITFFNSIEQELFKYKAELHNCQLESENDKKRIEELEAENLQLQMSSKSSISESQSILAEMENIRNRGGQTDTNILTEQLGEGMYLVSKLLVK